VVLGPLITPHMDDPHVSLHHNNSCYKFVPEKCSWDVAYHTCKEAKMELVSIETKVEFDMLVAFWNDNTGLFLLTYKFTD